MREKQQCLNCKTRVLQKVMHAQNLPVIILFIFLGKPIHQRLNRISDFREQTVTMFRKNIVIAKNILFYCASCMGWRFPSLSKLTKFLSHQVEPSDKPPQLIKASFTIYKYYFHLNLLFDKVTCIIHLVSDSTCVVVLTLWVRSSQLPLQMWAHKTSCNQFQE